MKHNIRLLVMGVLLSGLTVACGAQPAPSAEPVTAVIKATIDMSRPVGPFSPVHDMITPWNSKGNRMPFACGSAYDRRFREANFGMCRLVAFSDTWLWGTDVSRGKDGKISLDFKDFDALLDLSLSAGCEPYIRLAYNVPEALRSANQVDYGRPRDLAEWDQLMGDIVRHCNVTRKLGIRYFVAALNEADLAVEKRECSWEMILELYARTVKVVRQIDPSIKVGGPATVHDPRGKGTPYMRKFLRYCAENKLPLDFVCFHGYTKKHPGIYEEMLLAVKEMVAEEYPELTPEPEYFCDEFGLWSKSAKDDNEYGSAYITASHHFMRRGGIKKVCNISFNHFHKYDETFVYNDRIIKRYLGLPLLKGPVVTAPYFAIQMESGLSGQELPVELDGEGGITADKSAGIIATVDDKRIAMLGWSFKPNSAAQRDFEVTLKGLQPGEHRQLTQYLLDHDHSNPYTDYVLKHKDNNGGKYNLENGTMEQVRQETVTADRNGESTLKIRLQPFAVTLLILE